MNDYDAFHDEASDSAALRALQPLVEQLQTAEMKVTRLEEELKTANNVVVDIAEKQLPDAMEALGFNAITTPSGLKVQIVPILSVRPLVANREAVYKWLADHGSAGSIKRTAMVVLGKDSEDVMKGLASYGQEHGLQVKEEVKVESQTLKKFVSDWLSAQAQEAEDDNVVLDPLPKELFGVYESRRAKIKAGKKSTNSFK